jgi:hypothetical protein
MRLSPSYQAARFHHIRRIGMMYRFAELKVMEAKLVAQLDRARTAAAVGFAAGDDASVLTAAEIMYEEAYPLSRRLEIIRMAIPVAAERSINLRAVAHRATERHLGTLPSYRRYARGF